jgi:hypothetical protein
LQGKNIKNMRRIRNAFREIRRVNEDLDMCGLLSIKLEERSTIKTVIYSILRSKILKVRIFWSRKNTVGRLSDAYYMMNR